MADLSVLAGELKTIIEEQPDARCEDILAHIEKDPRMLGASILVKGVGLMPPPLNNAIKHNHLAATQAILEALTNDDHYQTLDTYLKTALGANTHSLYYPLGHLMYSSAEMGTNLCHLPHDFADNPKMVRLLRSYGYDFSARQQLALEGKGTEGTFPIYLVKRLMNSDLPWKEGNVDFLRAAMDSAIDQRESFQTISASIPRTFAEYLFAQASRKREAHNWENTRDLVLDVCARAGVDFRGVIDKNKASPTPTHKAALQSLNKICTRLAKHYFTGPKEMSQDCALAACSGGYFPQVLDRCLNLDKEKGASKEVPELISHLTSYWKNEYRYLIEAITTRTAAPAMAGSTLDKYTRGASFPGGSIA